MTDPSNLTRAVEVAARALVGRRIRAADGPYLDVTALAKCVVSALIESGELVTRESFTHVCVDCGALGQTGAYHDHGNNEAGDTIPLTALPGVIRSFQLVEGHRDQLLDELSEARALADELAEALTITIDPMDDINADEWKPVRKALDRYRKAKEGGDG